MSDNDIGHMTKKRISQGAYRQLVSTIDDMDDQTDKYTKLNHLLLHKSGDDGVRFKAMKINSCIDPLVYSNSRKSTTAFMNIRNHTFSRSNIITNPDGFDDEGIIVTAVSKYYIDRIMYTKHSLLRAFQRDPRFLKGSIPDQINSLFCTSQRIFHYEYKHVHNSTSFDVNLDSLTAKVFKSMSSTTKTQLLMVKTFIPIQSLERTIND